MSEQPIKSPCIHICYLNEDDICTGCFRNAAEITDWSELSSEQRRAILQETIERRETYGGVLLL